MTEESLKSEIKVWKTSCLSLLLVLAVVVTSPLWIKFLNKVNAPGSNAKRKACAKNLELIAQALDSYKAAHDGQYPSPKEGLQGLVPEHLETLPKCATGEDTYRVLYGDWADNPDDVEDYFLVWCKGPGHEGFPRYDHKNKVIETIYDFKISPR